MRLKDKVVLITGGANGIGRETACLFASEGAKIALADSNQRAGESVVREVSDTKMEILFTHTDVTDNCQVQRMVDTIVDKYGHIDVLINNAGITRDSLLADMSLKQWNAVISVNLTGVFQCTKAVVPIMIKQGKGRIINTASVVGIYGNIGQTNYAASKAGIIGMTRSWAKELGRNGITVNAVAPGFIATDMTATVPEKILDLMVQKTPLGRLGKASDVAYAYLFLASDEADFINGAILNIDGGLVL